VALLLHPDHQLPGRQPQRQGRWVQPWRLQRDRELQVHRHVHTQAMGKLQG
jgi:hypothetical protein